MGMKMERSQRHSKSFIWLVPVIPVLRGRRNGSDRGGREADRWIVILIGCLVTFKSSFVIGESRFNLEWNDLGFGNCEIKIGKSEPGKSGNPILISFRKTSTKTIPHYDLEHPAFQFNTIQ
jgi:hypothetical protein